MKLKILYSFAVLLFSFGVLFSSILRSASVKYSFNRPSENYQTRESKVTIPYDLPSTGNVSPGHFAWGMEVLRDKIWVLITTNPAKKAEVLSLLADKRLVFAREQFIDGKADDGMLTLVKAEGYLEKAVSSAEIAKNRGIDTTNLLQKLAFSSLKHREVMEECVHYAPEDAQPIIIKEMGIPERLFTRVSNMIIETGGSAPVDPF
ncbi:MAG: hypothetical protein UV74_C0001G0010 [Candidatus Woesebacteria bacterium GW2011_GWB1_43_14]|uniref:DUF5667 domain-containing protein n=1 Tax=Candidatus Woesebacteria bacterium GW2011_GWB1_43_14 TaxID=1618578 RepID=A0A0G1DLZ5_9BACT|nr:MAG: hypothetical protein UV51_C0011G0009 [Candidatus Woesebacteria bacterium GW2011_GWC1_42_9]KKS98900.1 MAG: hypothetical protein UV74_C0001G0010 [Candidatus Woesebacteria bacterium GW2011_GWB1_43_14]